MNSYEKLERDLKGKRKHVLSGRATYAAQTSENEISLYHHDTCIMIAHKDGTTTIRNGGWFTVTTKERINRYLPDGSRMYQKDWKWFLIYPPQMPEFAGQHVEFDGFDMIVSEPKKEKVA